MKDAKSSENQGAKSLYTMLAQRMAEKDQAEAGIYIFGAGYGGQILLQHFKKWKESNLIQFQIKGIFDNDTSKYGSYIGDTSIIAPRTDVIKDNNFIIIASLNYCDQMYRQLLALGIKEEQIIFDYNLLVKLLPHEDVPGHLRQSGDFLAGYIDIVDTCNLVCATCPRSTVRGTAKKMDIEIFCAILDKLKAANYSMIGLYNWSEPFLHPDILNFVKEVKKRSFVCGLSSNLALPRIPHLIDVVDVLEPNDGDFLIVSISGMKQSIYEINHRGGNIETVKKNIVLASQSKNKKVIRLKLLQFSYNLEEIQDLIEFCKQQGIAYETIEAGGNPLEAVETKVMPMVLSDPSNYCRELKSLAACPFIFDMTVINADGDAHLCCATPPESSYKLGSFLDQDLSALTLKRFFHPACAICSPPSPRRNFSDRDLALLKQGLKQAGEEWHKK